MKLYYRIVDGVATTPSELPFRVWPSGVEGEGMSRTDPTQWTDDEIAGWGFHVAPDQPDYDASTQHLDWTGSAWTVVTDPPKIYKIKKIYFLNRFTITEELRFEKLQRQAAALTPDQLFEQANLPLFYVTSFVRRLDAVDIVELNIDQTQQAIELLKQLGVFGIPSSNDAQERAIEMLVPPTAEEQE